LTAPRRSDASWLRPSGTGHPAIIAHAAGNGIEAARNAIADGADCVEVDLWYRNSIFEARHERRAGPIPLLYERWYLRRAPATPFTLADLVQQLDGDAAIFLDFKTSQHRSVGEVAAILQEAPAGTRIAASSQWWGILRHLHDRLPEVPLLYSVDVLAKLDLFRSVARHDTRPAGVSCRESLLTPAIIGELQDRGLRVTAWTVDDLSRAEKLASWGVDAITTHRVREMRALFTGSP
jgi:glycerophosphoryl diester phosphodiesterase